MSPKEIAAFSWRVIDQIQKLIEERGLTDAQVIRDSGMPRNTFYRKMRGETPLDTDDIAKLADALQVDPGELFFRASRARLRALNVGARQDTELETVELDITQLAASTDNTPIDPTRGEAD